MPFPSMLAGIYLDEMFGASIAHALAARGATRGLRVELAADMQPGARDSALLAYAARQQLVLVTRNVEDFRRLHEHWLVARDWGFHAQPHAGVLMPTGIVADFAWADIVTDLLLHPECPPLEDQLLLWRVKRGQWESEHPYSSRRHRLVTL